MRCLLTGQPIPNKKRGRPSDYISREASFAWGYYQAVQRLLHRLTFTPAAASAMRGRIVRMVHTLDGQREKMPHNSFTALTEDEQDLLRLIVACSAAFGLCKAKLPKTVRVARCVVTGSLFYAGARNPRKYVCDEAADLDHRLTQLLGALPKLPFTDAAKREFKRILYGLSCVAVQHARKATLGHATAETSEPFNG